ncbi:MAG: glucose 1-dehydrogenase [Rhizobiales bacterium TMED94]|nr:oxidoreductase [Rhodobiaceae bacterium]RPF85844.1 MAG: glucose 1-dehydrogenase [Rhizobiales bacterium TMED94]|tara:strand:- start:246 stop:1025 length:780 start_codon:yes stop_codon:yes gene_type:complete
MSILELFNLKDDVAVITGAGKGIGKGIAIALAEAGADVVLASRSEDQLKNVAKEIEKIGRHALVVPTNVTNIDSMENLGKKAFDKFGKLSIWVNNAGGLPDGTPRYLTKTSPDQFNAQLELNIKAAWSGCVVAAKYMSENGGSIINISSTSSKNMGPNIKNGPYGASKAAINSLTATFSIELAPHIRVNAVAPGPIPTENFIDSMNMDTPEKEEQLKKMINIPLKRWGKPEDIGAAVVFMASPASGWVTGQCLFVSGGL